MVPKPKKPYSKRPKKIYAKKDWERAPKDLEQDPLLLNGFRAEWHIVRPGENFVRIAAQYEDVDWEILTEFNWGTRVPKEINWYLEKCCGHFIKPTSDGKNYSFIGSYLEVDPSHARGIWAPKKIKHPFHRGQVLVPRSGTAIIDTLRCPYLALEDTTCQHVANRKGERIPCGTPALPDAPVPYEIKQTQPNQIRKAVESQDLEWVTLEFAEYLIHRIEPGFSIENPKSNEMLTYLSVVMYAEGGQVPPDPKKGPPKKEGARAAAGGSKLEVPKRPVPPSFGSHTFKDPQELRTVAQELRSMKDGGVLDRVVVRGYVDRNESTSLQHSLTLSKERAQGVLKILNQHLGNLLEEEPEAATSGPRKLRFQNRVARGFVPAKAIGCGAADAPFRKESPEHRVVIVDPEAKTAEEGDKPPVMQLDTKGWVFYEHGTGAARRSMLFAHCDSHKGTCETMSQVWPARREALDWFKLFFDIVEGQLDETEVRYIQERIQAWDAERTAELKKDFENGNLEPFTDLFWHRSWRTLAEGDDPSKREELTTALPDPDKYPVFMTLAKKAGTPDHWRTRGQFMSVSAMTDFLQAHPRPPEGKYAMQKRRIHFE
jgi:hypothetical protein